MAPSDPRAFVAPYADLLAAAYDQVAKCRSELAGAQAAYAQAAKGAAASGDGVERAAAAVEAAYRCSCSAVCSLQNSVTDLRWAVRRAAGLYKLAGQPPFFVTQVGKRIILTPATPLPVRASPAARAHVARVEEALRLQVSMELQREKAAAEQWQAMERLREAQKLGAAAVDVQQAEQRSCQSAAAAYEAAQHEVEVAEAQAHNASTKMIKVWQCEGGGHPFVFDPMADLRGLA